MVAGKEKCIYLIYVLMSWHNNTRRKGIYDYNCIKWLNTLDVLLLSRHLELIDEQKEIRIQKFIFQVQSQRELIE